MITDKQIHDLLSEHGEAGARRKLIEDHDPMDQTIDMKLHTLEKFAAEQKEETNGR